MSSRWAVDNSVDGYALLGHGILSAKTINSILSETLDSIDVRQALEAGALGYIPKSSSSHEMITALRLVLAGEVYVPPVMLAALEGLEAASVQVTAASVEEGGVEGLTPRQLEVLLLMAQGLSNIGDLQAPECGGRYGETARHCCHAGTEYLQSHPGSDRSNATGPDPHVESR